MELSGKIDQLRSEGAFESEGRFTIGLRHAREKLRQFMGVPQDHYLVLLVSAGIARGAQSIEISRDDCELNVVFEGASLGARELSHGFASLLSGESPPATLDLTLGLQGAFRAGSLEIEMEAEGEEGGFRWTVSEEKELFREHEEPSENQIKLRIRFQARTVMNRAAAWLKNLGGYVGMSPECRAVDRLCENAAIPIRINGTLVNRAYRLMESPIAGQVGEPPNAVVTPSPFRAEGSYPALLALVRGEVRVVIHGVTYSGLRHLGLDGLVYCDELNRDMSRVRLVEDQSMEHLCGELNEVRAALLRQMIPRLGELGRWADMVDMGLRELFREGQLDRFEMERVLRFLKEADGLGGIEVQRMSLLRAVADRFSKPEQKAEQEWVAHQGLRLALETFRRDPPTPEEMEMLLFFSRLTASGLDFVTLSSEFKALEHWEKSRPKKLEGTLWEELLANSLSTVLAFRIENEVDPTREGELKEMIGVRLRNRLRPQVLGPTLDLLEKCQQPWAAEVGLDLLRLATERHGFRDDRLLSKYLTFRARCSRYEVAQDPAWSLQELLAEAKFLAGVAYREPGVIGNDIATGWAPQVLSGLEAHAGESALTEAEQSRLAAVMGQIQTVISRLQ